MDAEYWGVSLVDLSEGMYGIESDAGGKGYIAFEGDKEVVRSRLIAAFTKLVDQQMYRANSYGSPWQEGDDQDDEV